MIDVEDSDQHLVHVDGLHAHPSQCGQQEIMDEDCNNDAQCLGRRLVVFYLQSVYLAGHEEAYIQKQQR